MVNLPCAHRQDYNFVTHDKGVFSEFSGDHSAAVLLRLSKCAGNVGAYFLLRLLYTSNLQKSLINVQQSLPSSDVAILR